MLDIFREEKGTVVIPTYIYLHSIFDDDDGGSYINDDIINSVILFFTEMIYVA